MPFTGDENHVILIKDAAALTARFRATIQPGAKIGGYFGRTAIEAILQQAGCVGIRYYYGIDDKKNQVMVLVGVDANENDLVTGKIAEISLPCPHYCSTANLLNSGT